MPVTSDSLRPHGYSLLGSSFHGTLQVRILKWVAITFSRVLPDPGIETRPPTLRADSLLSEAPEKYLSNQ